MVFARGMFVDEGEQLLALTIIASAMSVWAVMSLRKIADSISEIPTFD